MNNKQICQVYPKEGHTRETALNLHVVFVHVHVQAKPKDLYIYRSLLSLRALNRE